MGDLKLYLIDFFFYSSLFLDEIFVRFLNLIDPFFQNGLVIFNWKFLYQFPQNVSTWFAFKFCLSISFLILIRGGAPRYRYDYLTKLGWLKFLSLIILVFFTSLLLLFIF